MSDTPRADKLRYQGHICIEDVEEIERELTATRAELARAMRVVEAAAWMRSAYKLSDEASLEFAEWLAREMPPGTVINDPRWWAPRIVRAVLRAAGSEG